MNEALKVSTEVGIAGIVVAEYAMNFDPILSKKSIEISTRL